MKKGMILDKKGVKLGRKKGVRLDKKFRLKKGANLGKKGATMDNSSISSPSGWFRASLDINLYFASANCRKQQSGEKQHKMLLNIPGSLK